MSKKLSKYDLILETVKQIPKGKVASYGDVAKLSGLPGQPRLVGYALHNLSRNSDVPWQRVINSQGKISLPRKSGSYSRQKKLLEQEGIQFENERIDLDRFGIIQFLSGKPKR